MQTNIQGLVGGWVRVALDARAGGAAPVRLTLTLTLVLWGHLVPVGGGRLAPSCTHVVAVNVVPVLHVEGGGRQGSMTGFSMS